MRFGFSDWWKPRIYKNNIYSSILQKCRSRFQPENNEDSISSRMKIFWRMQQIGIETSSTFYVWKRSLRIDVNRFLTDVSKSFRKFGYTNEGQSILCLLNKWLQLIEQVALDIRCHVVRTIDRCWKSVKIIVNVWVWKQRRIDSSFRSSNRLIDGTDCTR